MLFVLDLVLPELGLEGEMMHTLSSSFCGVKAELGQIHAFSVNAAVSMSQLNSQNFLVFQFRKKRNTVSDQL